MLRENLVVATRPRDVNGFGMRPEDACDNIDRFLGRVTMLEETDEVQRTLRSIVRRHAICGKKIHDASIVATALSHRIDTIVTQNPQDFEIFESSTAFPLRILDLTEVFD